MKKNPSVFKKSDSSLLKIGEASKILGVSIDTLRRWEKAGKIETVRTPGGTRLYSLQALRKINPSISLRTDPSVETYQTESLSTEELLRKVGLASQEDSFQSYPPVIPSSPVIPAKAGIQLEESSSEVDPRLRGDDNNGFRKSLLTKFLIGAAFCSVVILAVSLVATVSYLIQPNPTRPSTWEESEPTSQVSQTKSNILPAGRQVLAVTTNLPFLEVNKDTQINGSLFVRDTINGLFLEATSSANTIALNSGTTTLTITDTALLDQDVSTTSSPTFSSLTLSSATKQITSGANIFTLPAATTTLVGTDTTQTLTNKSMSGASNTFTSIPNSALSNSKVTVTAGTNLTGGGDVSLGSSVTLTLKDSISLAGVLTLANGTAALPSLAFTNSTTTGFYRDSAGVIGVSTAGTEVFTFSASGIIPTTSATYDLGSSSLKWNNVYATNLTPSGTLLIADGTYSAPSLAFTNDTDSGLWRIGTNAIALTTAGSGVSGIAIDGSGNVGIGTTSPLSKLAVVGNAAFGTYGSLTAPANGLIVSGNVGIGTSAPGSYALNVNGTSNFASTVTLANGSATTPALNFTNGSGTGLWSPSTNALSLTTAGSGTSGITVTAAGNVGIATTAPAYAFDVNGTSRFVNNISLTSGASIIPLVTGGSDLGSSDLKFNNLYVNNINSSSSLSAVGQATFTYQPTSAAIGESTVWINPTTSTAGYSLLGISVGGVEKARITSDGYLGLGGANTPGSSYIINAGTSFNVGTNGNVGIGVSTANSKLTVIGNVGIGTSAAGSQLAVNGNGVFGWGTTSVAGPANGLAVFGNVGIGTTSPTATLNVLGDIAIKTGGSILDNLISFWKLDEVSGTRFDSVGTNNLTDNNTVTQAVGKINNAGQFTSANSEHLSIADNASLSTGDIDFTVAAWVYMDTKPFTHFVRKGNYASGPDTEYYVGYYDVTDRFLFQVSNGTTEDSISATTFGSPSTGTWYYVVTWHDSVANTINIQINNGTADSKSYTAGSNNSTYDFSIGKGQYANGRIDGVGFWKRVLTSAEKTALYNNANGRQLPPNLQEWQNSSGNPLATVDSSGNIGIGVSAAGSSLAVSGNGVFGWGTASVAGPANGLGVSGNVGIGTTTPSQALHVVGSAQLTGSVLSGDGTASAPAYSFSGDTDTGLWRIGANQLALTTAGGSHSGLSINSSGNVGIGTTNPADLLQVAGNIGFPSRSDVSTSYYIGRSGALGGNAAWVGFNVDSSSNNYLNFGTLRSGTSGGERMRIDPDGNVGINQVTPVQELDVVGTIRSNSNMETYYEMHFFGGTAFTANQYASIGTNTDGTARSLIFATGDNAVPTERMRIYASGNVGIGTSAAGSQLAVNGNSVIGWGTASVAGPANGLGVSGNVGIGTTSPLGALHVVGQCVTGDTRLRRRRRKKMEDGRWIDEWEEVPIKDMRPGDEILSMEPDGTFTWQKVNNLMDMGRQETYKLITNKGKQIRTTGNHPYFVLEKRPAKVLEKLYTTFEIDQSNRLEDMGIDSVVALASNEMGQAITIKISKKAKLAIYKKYYQNKRKLFGPEMMSTMIIYAIWTLGLKAGRLIIDKEYPSYEEYISNFITRSFPEIVVSFRSIGHQVMAHRAAWSRATKRRTPARSVLLKTLANLDFEESLATELLHSGLVTGDSQSTRSSLLPVYQSPISLSMTMSEARWIPAQAIRKGMLVATIDGWEVITAIYKTGVREQVYDIEVEGTHNFLGNDIVAHNTYLNGSIGVGTLYTNTTTPANGLAVQGNVGIGTTSPLSVLDVRGNITLLAGSDIRPTSDSTTAINIANAAGTDFVTFDTTNSRVGIGTADPGGKLHVTGGGTSGTLLRVGNNVAPGASNIVSLIRSNDGVGDGDIRSFLDTRYDASGNIRMDIGVDARSGGGNGWLAFWTSTNSPSTIGERVRIDSSGNVGIGFTSPTALGHIVNTAAADSFKVEDAANDNTVFLVDQSGNVGIGVSGPAAALGYNLDVWGTARITGATTLTGNLTSSGVFLAPDGTASAPAYSFSGDTDSGLWRIGANQLALTTAGSAFSGLSVNSSGNIGIGTTSASAKLHTLSTTEQLRLSYNSSIQSNFTVDVDGSLTIDASTQGNNFIRFKVSGASNPSAETLTLKGVSGSKGLVGINNTNPTYDLDVTGTGRMTGGAYFGSAGTSTFLTIDTTSILSKTLNANANSRETSNIASSWLTNTQGSERGLLVFKVARPDSINATDLNEVLRLVGGSSSSNTGNVGINNSAPSYSLDVVGTGRFSSAITASSGLLSSDGTASTPAYSFSGDTDSGLWRIGANQLALTTAGSAFSGLSVNSNGNIGIGTTGPGYKMHVLNGTSNAVIRTESAYVAFETGKPNDGANDQAEFIVGNAAPGSGDKYIIMGLGEGTGKRLSTVNTDDGYITTYGAANLAFGTNLTERVRIDTNGNVGIGTSAAGSRLAVNGNGIFGWGTASVAGPANGLAVFGNVGIGTTSPGAPLEVRGSGSSATIAKFTDEASTGCTLATGGTISCSSDINLKKNINDLSYDLSDLMKLRAVEFNWKTEDDTAVKNLGFIAQEVETVIPKLVTTNETTGLKELNTIGMIPLLTRSIQSQQAQIASQSAQFQYLLSNLSLDNDGTLIVPKLKAGSIILDSSIASSSAKLSITDSQLSINTDPDLSTLSVAEGQSADNVFYDLTGKIATLEERITTLESGSKMDPRLRGDDREKSGDDNNATSSASVIASQAKQSSASNGEVATDSLQNTSKVSSGSFEVDELNLTPPDILYATGSATLANLKVTSEATFSGMLAGYDLNISNSLKSLGITTLGKTTIAGDLSVDGTLSIENGSEINVIGALYLQKSSLAQSLDIFNGKVIVDASGNITTTGTVIASEVKTQKLTISNDVIASQAKQSSTSNGEIATSSSTPRNDNATIGTSILPANLTKVTIQTSEATENAKIFITPVTITDKVLSVANIKNKESFDVVTLSPSLVDINFNWWIVQTE